MQIPLLVNPIRFLKVSIDFLAAVSMQPPRKSIEKEYRLNLLDGGIFMRNTFKGGLHIEDHKALTCAIPPEPIADCPQHIFLLQQHVGAVLTPLVKPGDPVKVGQKIADSDALMSVPVHSSISGTVKAIKPWPHPSGAEVDAIVVDNDFRYTKDASIRPNPSPDKMTPKELLSIIREKGLVGMGGAGFPVHIKLNPTAPVDVLVVNAAECEPYITSDHRRMLQNAPQIIDGILLCMKILNVKKAYIGIETNKPDCAKVFAPLVKGNGITVKMLKTKYPQGAEKQLIKAVTGRTVMSGKLPADAGAVVVNVDTAFRISQAVREGMPILDRIITVAGDHVVKKPCNLLVRIGVPFSFVFEQAGGFADTPKKIIMGGPMMGLAQYSLDTPVVKTTSALLAFDHPEEVYNPALVCIRCGRCVERCPMRLMPFQLKNHTLHEDWEAAEKYHITDCIECGLCSYVCPAEQNLLQSIRVGKQAVLQKKKNGGKK